MQLVKVQDLNIQEAQLQIKQQHPHLVQAVLLLQIVIQVILKLLQKQNQQKQVQVIMKLHLLIY